MASPDRDALRSMLPQRVLDALETGQMISMATGRSAAERRAIAEFVARDVGPVDSVVELGAGYCDFINQYPAATRTAGSPSATNHGSFGRASSL